VPSRLPRLKEWDEGERDVPSHKKKKKKNPLPRQYDAPVGSKRYKQLKKAAKLYKQGKKKQAFAMRERMEKRIRDARKKKSKAKKR